MTALARWRRMKETEERGPIAKRPNDVRECTSLADAERFRREVLSDISKKITNIQVSFFTLLKIFFCVESGSWRIQTPRLKR